MAESEKRMFYCAECDRTYSKSIMFKGFKPVCPNCHLKSYDLRISEEDWQAIPEKNQVEYLNSMKPKALQEAILHAILSVREKANSIYVLVLGCLIIAIISAIVSAFIFTR